MIREMHFFYYAFIDSEIVRLSRSNSDVNAFVTLSYCFFKKYKQGSKLRSIISMLNRFFDKHLIVFNVSADTAANFMKHFLLL